MPTATRVSTAGWSSGSFRKNNPCDPYTNLILQKPLKLPYQMTLIVENTFFIGLVGLIVSAYVPVIVAGAILLSITTSLLYVDYRRTQHNKNMIAHQNAEFHQLLLEKDELLKDKDTLLVEKDWLLKEVHHRVKNNLQVITSLLAGQTHYLDDGPVLNAIRDVQNRVQSISLIHQKLYTGADVTSVNMLPYAYELVDHLQTCFDTRKKGIQFERQTDPINMEVSQAIAVGLILNEAITNSIKYAFPNGRGKITISLLSAEQNRLRLTIADNGVGMARTDAAEGKTSLGWELIRILTRQLAGNLNIDTQAGVAISITFPYEKAVGESLKDAFSPNLTPPVKTNQPYDVNQQPVSSRG
jgi:two-component sensor histidine kinase